MKWFKRARERRAALAISSVAQYLVNPRAWLMIQRREIQELASNDFLSAQLDRIAVRISLDQAPRQEQEP